MKRKPRRHLACFWASLAISPFVVGFNANDSTGWHFGGGISHTRSQYSTGCSPKYYSQEHTEFAAHLDYVKARNAENQWSPAKQVAFDFEIIGRTRTLLAEEVELNDDESTLRIIPKDERHGQSMARPLLRIRGALAWKYLELALGGLMAPSGGLGDVVVPTHRESHSVSHGFGNHLLPTAGIRVMPVEHFYASANLLNGSTTLLSSGFANVGLGFKTRHTDLWIGYGIGVVDGEKILLSLEQEWMGIKGLVTVSVLTDLQSQEVGSLRPGDWADIGLALHFPLGNKTSR